MKKKPKKHSADYKLDSSQFPKLNQNFYDGFLTDYYDIKLMNLMGIISSTEDFTEFLMNSDFKLGFSELRIGSNNLEQDRFNNYAKLELAMTYYHCLETFIRVFIAHAKISECPWLELSRLTQKNYKEWLEKLSQNKFNGLNDVLNEESTILWVFTGNRNLPKQMRKKDLKGIMNWVKWSATQLLQTYDYNSFKHGLAVTPKEVSILIGQADDLKIEKTGDALQFISKIENESRYKWSKQTLWIPYDSRAAIIYTISMFIKNIIGVGRAIHLRESYTREWLPTEEWSPKFLLSKKENNTGINFGLSLNGLGQELIYLK